MQARSGCTGQAYRQSMDVCVCVCMQVSLSQLLLDLGKRNEAKSTIRTVLDRATLVSGMEGDLAMCARIAYRRIIGRDV